LIAHLLYPGSRALVAVKGYAAGPSSTPQSKPTAARATACST